MIDTVHLDGAMFLTTSHAWYKKKAGGWEGAAPPCAILMYMGIASAERIHVSSLYLFAGRRMSEARWRGFQKRWAPGPPFADRL